MKARKKSAYEEALRLAIELEDEGHRIERLTDWHWRIDGQVDVWPSGKKFLLTGQNPKYVKDYEDLRQVIKSNVK